MQKGLSRPKNQIRFLLLEGISPSAVEVLRSAGYDNVEVVAKALDQAALIAALKNVQILGIRSRTQVTEAVIAAAPSVVALGCFSVGTNQVDLEATRRRGVPLFNSPFSNTRSRTAERQVRQESVRRCTIRCTPVVYKKKPTYNY